MAQISNYSPLQDRFVLPNEILDTDSSACFVLKPNFPLEPKIEGPRLKDRHEEVINKMGVAALLAGCDYYFETQHLRTRHAIFWRTENLELSLIGASGSVLCLGQKGDRVARACVFQNYETSTMRSRMAFWHRF